VIWSWRHKFLKNVSNFTTSTYATLHSGQFYLITNSSRRVHVKNLLSFWNNALNIIKWNTKSLLIRYMLVYLTHLYLQTCKNCTRSTHNTGLASSDPIAAIRQLRIIHTHQTSITTSHENMSCIKKPHITAFLFFTGYKMKPNNIFFLNIFFFITLSDWNITLLYIRVVTVMVFRHYKFKHQRHDCGKWGSVNTLKRYVKFTAIDIRHTTKPYPTHSLPAEYQ
jgi:hypothetical protein